MPSDPVTEFSPPAWQDYAGSRWYRNGRDGYYRDRTGRLLHRAVLEDSLGRPVPEGCEVHHINHDRADNALANLLLVTAEEHRALHPGKLPPMDRSAAAVEQWRKRAPVDLLCRICGSPFSSRGMRALYCSPRCRDEAHARRSREGGSSTYRRSVQRVCEHCGAGFSAVSERARFCSGACKKRFRRSRTGGAAAGAPAAPSGVGPDDRIA
jgi:hypothetical protein